MVRLVTHPNPTTSQVLSDVTSSVHPGAFALPPTYLGTTYGHPALVAPSSGLFLPPASSSTHRVKSRTNSCSSSASSSSADGGLSPSPRKLSSSSRCDVTDVEGAEDLPLNESLLMNGAGSRSAPTSAPGGAESLAWLADVAAASRPPTLHLHRTPSDAAPSSPSSGSELFARSHLYSTASPMYLGLAPPPFFPVTPPTSSSSAFYAPSVFHRNVYATSTTPGGAPVSPPTSPLLRGGFLHHSHPHLHPDTPPFSPLLHPRPFVPTPHFSPGPPFVDLSTSSASSSRRGLHPHPLLPPHLSMIPPPDSPSALYPHLHNIFSTASPPSPTQPKMDAKTLMAYRVPMGKEGSLKHRLLSQRPLESLHRSSSLEDIDEEGDQQPETAKTSSSAVVVDILDDDDDEEGAQKTNGNNGCHSEPTVTPPVAVSPTKAQPTAAEETHKPKRITIARSHRKRKLPPVPPLPSLHYPTHFMKGSVIQLASGELKRVEDMLTEDFVHSADLSPDLKIDSSTVVRIDFRKSGIDDAAAGRMAATTSLLSFSVGEHRFQVTVEAAMEHPFFVFGRGWSSCSPERTEKRYGLTCHKLQVGDVCVSLTHKTLPNKTFRIRGRGVGQEPEVEREPSKRVAAQTQTMPLLATMTSSSRRSQSESGESEVQSERRRKNSSNSEDSPRKRRWSAPDALHLDESDSGRILEQSNTRTGYAT